MSRKTIQPETIDEILPQTQCGLCGFKGCLPYANAIISENASIDLCPPGGVDGLKKIANIVNEDPAPFIEKMQQNSKPKKVAVIREDVCIGCTKCIQACPVDAILGAPKLMHTVITDECTGCKLCIAPCPVDCIDLFPAEDPNLHSEKYRERFQFRNHRLQNIKIKVIKSEQEEKVHDKQNYLKAALARKKLAKTV